MSASGGPRGRSPQRFEKSDVMKRLTHFPQITLPMAFAVLAALSLLAVAPPAQAQTAKVR